MYLNYGKVTKCEDLPIQAPLQYQPQQPGIESIMIPRPIAVVPYLRPGSTIINTSSVTSMVGFEQLIDYSATKGAVSAFTRSLALSLLKRGIRVNAVAPGRTWTPLIPASLPPEMYMTFGSDNPIARPSAI